MNELRLEKKHPLSTQFNPVVNRLLDAVDCTKAELHISKWHYVCVFVFQFMTNIKAH